MKERSKKAPSPENFNLEPDEFCLCVKRVKVENSYFPAYSIFKLVEDPNGKIVREKLFGPDDVRLIGPNVRLFTDDFITGLK